MPRGDGTGPTGTGSMTGRGIQRCMMFSSSQSLDKVSRKAYLNNQKK